MITYTCLVKGVPQEWIKINDFSTGYLLFLNARFVFGRRQPEKMNIGKLVLAGALIIGFVCGVKGLFITDWLSRLANSVGDVSDNIRCRTGYAGCCDRNWTKQDFSDLHDALQRNVYGQNIMTDIIVPALQGHLMPNTPRGKALTISFHGRPGIGKNYVTSFIQNILFHKIHRNKYVHFFTGRIHFPLESHVLDYRINLALWIKGNVSKCEYSLFIFDEVDKMPPGVLDVVAPFLDYHDHIDGIDFRKSIFIFISNTGGDLIAKQYITHWKSGRKRKELRLADFEDLIRIGAFNEKGGLYRSETIASSLIDHYVPFLPLEEEHVRKCINDEFKKRYKSSSRDMVNEIIEDLTFGPDENPIFSNGGCKRIAPKVAAIIERSNFMRSSSHDEF